MIKYLILILICANSYGCPLPYMINQSKQTYWSRMDLQVVKNAQKTCIKEYKKCLKVFIKIDIQDYKAICGKGV